MNKEKYKGKAINRVREEINRIYYNKIKIVRIRKRNSKELRTFRHKEHFMIEQKLI
jgi:hypothetical protein